MTSSLTVKSSADLLAFVPTQLGFWPANSLVLMSVQGKHLGAMLRTDLPSAGGDILAFARTIAEMISADKDATRYVVALYSDESPDGAYDPHFRTLMNSLALALPHELAGVFLVQSERVFALDSDETFPVSDIKGSPMALELAFRGHGYAQTSEVNIPPAPPASDRETETYSALLDAFRSAPPLEAQELVRNMWRDNLQQETLSLSQLKGMLSTLQDKQFRDIAIGNTSSPGPIPVEDEATLCHYLMGSVAVPPDWKRIDAAEQVLRELLTIAPNPYRPAPLCALAMTQWKKGRASRADSYIKAALDIDPTYRLAVLLAELFSRSMICDWAKDKATAYTGPN
ncbi:DUF4192 domain-containing protein [Pseudarthrobacter sp. Y6]|uniref:DUF4192 domain-containing protein n=1 Tax=Pseudarthrobacter sp. Y6 TaxID=3418422 RepID=UPI003CFA697F